MPEFIYLGPHDGVELAGHGSVERDGDPVTVPAGVAAELRESPDSWQEIKPRAKKPTNKAEES